MERKISRLLFGKQENKRECVNKVFNENAGFFLASVCMRVFLCECLSARLTKPIAISHCWALCHFGPSTLEMIFVL